jgi:cardiolipin synthase
MPARYLDGNRVDLLQSGTEYFPALEAAIRAAREEIHLEAYIYEGDATGLRFTDALCQASRRGVVVRVLVDGFGSREMPRVFQQQFRDAGVRLLIYRPELSLLRIKRHRLRRMHRKLAVIDAQVAFVGGINIIDDLSDPGAEVPRYDYAVRVEGPLLESIHREAQRLWSQVAWVSLRHRWRPSRRVAVKVRHAGSQRAALLVRDNIRHRDEIEGAYLEAIRSAKGEIFIANAYFFPGVKFRRALIEAASRGVRVVLLLQGKVEYALLHYASRSLYGTLMDAGVEIHEYHRAFLHAKVAVVDNHWCTVGSSNIDPFSLMLAREANVAIEDALFAARLRASLQRALDSGSRTLRASAWRAQPWPERATSWLAYGLARFLMGMAGYGGQH